MKRQYTTIISLLTMLLAFVGMISCEHEIDFDYPVTEGLMVFDGEISNEGVFLRISHSRPVTDSAKCLPIGSAQVWISDDEGSEEQLYYDPNDGCYHSATGLVGIPGHTYRMRATVEGRDYEATTTMQLPVQVDTVFFRDLKVLSERIFFLCLRGKDPIPDERNYYLCRLMRGNEVFRWNPRSGRSSVGGEFEYDIVCSTERDMDNGIDDEGKIPLMEGDTIRVVLMTIDRPSWCFFQSSLFGESTTANPISNIKGGAQGVFMAANINHADTLVFHKEEVLNNKNK